MRLEGQYVARCGCGRVEAIALLVGGKCPTCRGVLARGRTPKRKQNNGERFPVGTFFQIKLSDGSWSRTFQISAMRRSRVHFYMLDNGEDRDGRMILLGHLWAKANRGELRRVTGRVTSDNRTDQ